MLNMKLHPSVVEILVNYRKARPQEGNILPNLIIVILNSVRVWMVIPLLSSLQIFP
jgi:hypothetical protein